MSESIVGENASVDGAVLKECTIGKNSKVQAQEKR
jgi:hypothetical protein